MVQELTAILFSWCIHFRWRFLEMADHNFSQYNKRLYEEFILRTLIFIFQSWIQEMLTSSKFQRVINKSISNEANWTSPNFALNIEWI